MKKAIFNIVLCAIMVSTLGAVAFAGDALHFDVKARITSTTALTVNIAKVIGTSFTYGQPSVDFGQLALDPANNVYRPADGGFYAVDVAVSNNSGTWTVTHTRTDVNLQGATGTIPTLSDKINVTFMKQPGQGVTGTPAKLTNGYVSYANSNNFAVTSAALGAGYFLRIYYGIATGTTTGDSADASGAVAIPSTQASGNYLGQVTLTLTP
jgi:hypothetical protein